MKKHAPINISLETKSMLDSVKSPRQSYDGVIRELVKSWQERGYWERRREKRREK